jgi:hypothetical protein
MRHGGKIAAQLRLLQKMHSGSITDTPFSRVFLQASV